MEGSVVTPFVNPKSWKKPARSALEALRRGYRIIQDPRRWTQGLSAVDANGDWTEPKGPQAVCFCSVGAVCRVAKGMRVYNKAIDALTAETSRADCRGIVSYNDTFSHAEVLKVWRAAIRRLAQKAARRGR